MEQNIFNAVTKHQVTIQNNLVVLTNIKTNQETKTKEK